jgi:hypothetical protein
MMFKCMVDKVEFDDNEFKSDQVEPQVQTFIIINNVVDVAFKLLLIKLYFI